MLWPLPLVMLVSVKRRKCVLVMHVFSTTQRDVMFRRLPCSSQDTDFLRFYIWATYGQNANTEKLEEGTFPIIKKERKKETHEEMPRVFLHIFNCSHLEKETLAHFMHSCYQWTKWAFIFTDDIYQMLSIRSIHCEEHWISNILESLEMVLDSYTLVFIILYA